MGLPLPDWDVAITAFLALVFFGAGLSLLVWCLMDWYEDR